jgi:hypothetical protein
MGVELLRRYWKLLWICRRFRPDVMVARMGISIGLIGWLLRIPRLVIEDSEHAKLQLKLSLPFATRIVTGFGYLKEYGARQVRFESIPVMMYLAPDVFTPDAEALGRLGVDAYAPLIVLRLVSWGAAHDIGHAGAGDSELRLAIGELSRFGRVVVSSERGLPADLKQYENPVPAARLHDLLAYATLCIGEGGTIAAEAAVLGTPAIFASPLRVGYLLALEERWGLARNVDTLAEGLAIAKEWLARPDLKQEWRRRRRERFLAECEDANAFMMKLILELGGGKR